MALSTGEKSLEISIHWRAQLVFEILIHWIVFYPVDSAIHLLNNLGQKWSKTVGNFKENFRYLFQNKMKKNKSCQGKMLLKETHLNGSHGFNLHADLGANVGKYLPSPCTASFQALSVTAFR